MICMYSSQFGERIAWIGHGVVHLLRFIRWRSPYSPSITINLTAINLLYMSLSHQTRLPSLITLPSPDPIMSGPDLSGISDQAHIRFISARGDTTQVPSAAMPVYLQGKICKHTPPSASVTLSFFSPDSREGCHLGLTIGSSFSPCRGRSGRWNELQSKDTSRQRS